MIGLTKSDEPLPRVAPLR